ncbi:CHAT domain-containing protein [Xylariaceae sp. FL0255]|nr:CHAT domain-containing protein [Xylariaceae sp. FL0255]
MATPNLSGHSAKWTAFPSLLSSLNPELQLALERACEARQCGRPKDARQIFHERFPDRNRVPLLVFEYADLLTDQGMEGERISFLQECAASLDLLEDSDEQYLLNLMLADAKMWAFGSLKTALQTARQSRSWLDVDPKDPLSDLQVRGIQLYHQLMDRGLRDSNWVESSEVAALSSSGGSLFNENAALALAMESQGKLSAAARFKVDQINTADHAELPQLCDDIAVFCDKLDATGLPPLAFRAAYTRWTLTLLCPVSHEGLAQRCRGEIVSQLQRLARLQQPPTDWQAYAPRMLAKMQTRGFDPDQLVYSKPSPEHLESIVDCALARGDATMAMTAMESAILVLKNCANQLADQTAVGRLRAELSRYLDIHRSTTRSLRSEAMALMEMLQLVYLRGNAYELILDEVARFHTRAPNFDVPLLLERFYSMAQLAARELNRQELLIKYDQLHSKAIEDMAPRPGQAPLHISAVINRITENAKDAAGWGRNAVEIVLMWAADEVRLGDMGESDWKKLFGFYHPTGQPRSPAFLDLLARVQVEHRNLSKTYFQAPRGQWQARLESLHTWLSKDGGHVPLNSRDTVLQTIAKAWLFNQRSDWIKTTHAADENSVFAQHRSADEDLARCVGSLNMAQSPSMVGLPSSLAAQEENVIRVLLQLLAGDQGRITSAMIDHAIKDSSDVADEYEKRQNYLGMFNIFRRQGELRYHRHKRDPALGVSALDDALASMLRATQVFDEVRRYRSVSLAQHHSIAAKMQQLRKFSTADVYAKGVAWNRRAWNIKHQFYGQASNNPVPSNEDAAAKERREGHIKELRLDFEKSYAGFLVWIQRSKGRALLDLLSVDMPIPQALLDTANKDDTTKSLIEGEQKLVKQLSESSFPENIRLREELGKQHVQMRSNPLLTEIMRIRDGDTVTPYEIYDFLQNLPDKVVLVDFFYVDFDGPIRAVCYRKGLTYFPALMHDISMDEIKAWTKYIEHPGKAPLGNAATGNAALALLTPVLLPLFKVGKGSPNRDRGPVIRPDDTIVFCPTGPLHSLPLHAIPIDGVPLIETHPVIYCPSLTVLRHCFQKLQDSATPTQSQHGIKNLVMNTMPSHWPKADADAEPEPVTSISASNRLSVTLQATFLQGVKHTKDEIKSLLPGTAHFHYHGHVKYVPKAAMRSHLILDGNVRATVQHDLDANPPTTSELASQDRESEKQSHLTAEDIFNCPLAEGGALAALVGCRSGGADVSAADDVLGLPMALFCAGATAVVSSLWKLKDEDGASWAEEFYEELTGIQQSDKGNISAEHIVDELVKEEGKAGPDTENGKANKAVPDYVNLAKAMQMAVRRLRSDEKGVETAPYHWAGYVLSGYWMLSRTVVTPSPGNRVRH